VAGAVERSLMRELVERWAPLVASALCGCLVDSSAPCGDQLREAESGACACPSGYSPSGNVCIQDEPAPEAPPGPVPECTSGSACECQSSRECPPGELCDSFGSGRCAEAPAGLGAACSGSADCAGGEATYCDLFASRSCQVQGCLERAGECPGDYICCNYTILSTSLCIPADTSPEGGCPTPGQLVMRSQR
jgi:hypothetical protein